MSTSALLVFGSGPGIGINVARLFAERGFAKIILMSRNESRLKQEADSLRNLKTGGSVDAIQVDASDVEGVRKALAKAQTSLKDANVQLECVLFNTARTGPSRFFEFEETALEADLRTAVVSLYTVSQWAMPKLLETAAADENKTPSILVTSGMLAKDPFPAMFSLAACKAAQYSLTHSLHKEFEPKGVHCALVVVGGTVSDDSKVTNARNIAEETWKLFRTPRGKGKLEVFLNDPDYEAHIKRREQNKA